MTPSSLRHKLRQNAVAANSSSEHSSSEHSSSEHSSSERGASPVSVIIMIVILLMVAELIVMGGRLAAANADVSAAAREGARQGSVSLSVSTALPAAESAVASNLQNDGNLCLTPNVDPAGTDFRAGGNMTIEVSCTVEMSDLSLLSLPWPSLTVDAKAVETIETFRVVE